MLDFEPSIHENWNRYYDPYVGRYLSPEPLLQDPRFVTAMAKRGLTTPAYAYAVNNPIGYYDPDGLGVINWSSRPIWFKKEGSSEVVQLNPGEIHFGYQDGVTTENCDGKVYKTVDLIDVVVTDDGITPLPNWPLPLQYLRGVWKGSDFVAQHPDWGPLSRKGR